MRAIVAIYTSELHSYLVAYALEQLETQEILCDFGGTKIIPGDLTQSPLFALNHGR
jgi:hypothetical protein